jgi:hypothetical protein
MLSDVMLVVVMYRVALKTKKTMLPSCDEFENPKFIFLKNYTPTTFGANVIKLFFIFDYQYVAKKA